jgi:hypothetical protein
MPTRTQRTYEVTQIEMTLETSQADFTRAFESVLGRMLGLRKRSEPKEDLSAGPLLGELLRLANLR